MSSYVQSLIYPQISQAFDLCEILAYNGDNRSSYPLVACFQYACRPMGMNGYKSRLVKQQLLNCISLVFLVRVSWVRLASHLLKVTLNFQFPLPLSLVGIIAVRHHFWLPEVLEIKSRASCMLDTPSTNGITPPAPVHVKLDIRRPQREWRGWETTLTL